MSNYVEPISVPAHVKEALKEQTKRFKISYDDVVSICRIWESLRPEAQDGNESWFSVMDLEENSRVMLRERLESITENALNYLRNFSEAPEGEEDALAAFETAFKLFLSSEIGFRAQIAILRALEISELGVARLHPKRFAALISDDRQAMGESTRTDQEQLADRARWIIDAIEETQYRGLTPQEIAVVQDIKNIDCDDLILQNVTSLEYLLVKTMPQHGYWSNEDGRSVLRTSQLVEMRKGLERLKTNNFSGLDTDTITFLNEVINRADKDIDQSVVIKVFKIIAQTLK